MAESTATVKLDPTLLPFVTAVDEPAARAQLEELLLLVAPVIKTIVRRSDSAEDDFQESSQQIIKALWQCKSDPERQPIGDFQRYVRVVASHVVKRRWRAKHPAYHSLRESLRYLLRNDDRFVVWETEKQSWFCGLNHHRNQKALTETNARLAQLLQNPLAYDEDILPGRDTQSVKQSDLVEAVFRWLEQPMSVDQLTSIIFTLRKIESPVAVYETDEEDELSWKDTLSDDAPLQDQTLEWRRFLMAFWTEIELLPPLQRIAYLLNFTVGEGALEIFWLHGVATVRRIGMVLQLTDEQFARIWDELTVAEQVRKQALQLTEYDQKFALLWRYLPLNDLTIARLIGTERQKVINLRKAAGDRLARRLSVFRRER